MPKSRECRHTPSQAPGGEGSLSVLPGDAARIRPCDLQHSESVTYPSSVFPPQPTSLGQEIGSSSKKKASLPPAARQAYVPPPPTVTNRQEASLGMPPTQEGRLLMRVSRPQEKKVRASVQDPGNRGFALGHLREARIRPFSARQGVQE